MASCNHSFESPGEEVQDRQNGHVVKLEVVLERNENREQKNTPLDLLYSLEDTPPIGECIIVGLQHMLMSMGTIVTFALTIARALCADDNVVKAEILNTSIFVSGLITLLQTTFGTRLPILQGSTASLLVPTFAILSLEKFGCRATPEPDYVPMNTTNNVTPTTDDIDDDDEWKVRMREIQGAVIGASLFEVFIGGFGLIGFLLRFIGPLVIAPVIALIGVSLFGVAANDSAGNWYVALMTSAFILIFSQYLGRISIPCFCYKKDANKCLQTTSYPFFKLYPVVLAMLVSWLICYILTVTGAFPDDPKHFAYGARTDLRAQVLTDAKWFRFPYPFQWGTPTFSVSSVFGMLSGVFAGIIESVGDYYACARASGAPPPPMHAINRGICIEGTGSVLAGMWGTGNGTTSYSLNIAAISITRVGSRRVVQCAGVIMLIVGLIGKFGALFVTIPSPVIGGVFLVMFGMIATIGISNLQYVDMNSSRNLCIFGFSFLLGLSLPQWLARPENQDVINTGSDIIDQIFTVLLRTSMFVGGTMAFILDNTIPGTREERGMDVWHVKDQQEKAGSCSLSCYDFPIGMDVLRKSIFCKYFPVCPTFSGFNISRKWRRAKTDSLSTKL